MLKFFLPFLNHLSSLVDLRSEKIVEHLDKDAGGSEEDEEGSLMSYSNNRSTYF